MSALGEMWGEKAVQAPACLVVCRSTRNVVKSMVGGSVLADFGIEHKTWERWRGTLIFIPQIIEIVRHKDGSRIDQLMTGGMSYDLDATDFKERAKKKHESFWRPTWWQQP